MWAAHATTAGAVRDLSPATNPMPSASNSVYPEFMVVSPSASRHRFESGGALRQRQPNLKTCIAGRGTQLNVSAVLLHNALDRVETEPGSLADCLRREERFKNVRLDLG